MTPVEILRGAKVELAARGLWKGAMFQGDSDKPGEGQERGHCHGPCDIYGACILAAKATTTRRQDEPADAVVDTFLQRSHALRVPVWAAVAPLIQRAASELKTVPSKFNDRPETAVDDVLALLDRAIALAEVKS